MTTNFLDLYQDEPTQDISLRLRVGVGLAVWSARTRHRWLVRWLRWAGVL